jgi:presenilin-like A22 family membrane protease
VSTAALHSRLRRHIDLDWYAGLLVALLLAVQLAAVWVASGVVTRAQTTSSQSLPAQTTTPETAGLYVGIIVAESIVLVVLYRYASLLPAWVWRGLKWGLFVSVAMGAIWLSAIRNGAVETAALVSVATIFYSLAVWFDMNWLLHNAPAFTAAVLGALLVGVVLSPRVVLVFLTLLTVWDMVAVWKSDWMDGLIGVAASAHLPIYMILPSALQLDMSALREWLVERDGPKPDGVAGILGVGDLAIPAALSVSVVVALPSAWRVVVAGVVSGGVAGMVALRGSLSSSETLPALPWLTTGTMLGFAAGAIAGPVSLLAVLGGSI